ncbi:hypothetical protein A9K97_gp178 [Tokyovirus A1]|uniref:hypothetical protein n=1 Tax=Tokyovirus A1 TaxID=1826170 RepID=UPI0007A9612C|nr:hypothetical protein A9K97_gp178 [Tokyovirus A1]BAU80173.1 hypothetical protein [Tokyovirus A1]
MENLIFDRKSCKILGLEYKDIAPTKYLNLDLYIESSTETMAFLQIVGIDNQSSIFSLYPQLCEKLDIECQTLPRHGTPIKAKFCL